MIRIVLALRTVAAVGVAFALGILAISSVEAAPGTAATSADGAAVSFGALRVVDRDNISLPTTCAASPTGHCYLFDNGGSTGLYQVGAPAPAWNDNVTAGMLLAGPRAAPQWALASLSKPYPTGCPTTPLTDIAVGTTRLVYFSEVSAYGRLLVSHLLTLYALVSSSPTCQPPQIEPTVPGSPPLVDVGNVRVNAAGALPPPPPYVRFSQLDVAPGGAVTVRVTCTTSRQLRGRCVVRALFVTDPRQHTVSRSYATTMFLPSGIELSRGRTVKLGLRYMHPGAPSGSASPSPLQAAAWRSASAARLNAEACDTGFHGCAVVPLKYGDAGNLPPELFESPSLRLSVRHG